MSEAASEATCVPPPLSLFVSEAASEATYCVRDRCHWHQRRTYCVRGLHTLVSEAASETTCVSPPLSLSETASETTCVCVLSRRTCVRGLRRYILCQRPIYTCVRDHLMYMSDTVRGCVRGHCVPPPLSLSETASEAYLCMCTK